MESNWGQALWGAELERTSARVLTMVTFMLVAAPALFLRATVQTLIAEGVEMHHGAQWGAL